MTVRARGALRLPLGAAAAASIGTRPTFAATLISATTTRAGTATRTPAAGLAIRLLLTATVGVAMAAGAGIDAVRHVPGAERGGVAVGKRLVALRCALLERLLRLLGRRFAADGQTAVALRTAAAV